MGANESLLDKKNTVYYADKIHSNIKSNLDKRGDRESMEALDLLENVDDDLDRLNVGMVKVCTDVFNE